MGLLQKLLLYYMALAVIQDNLSHVKMANFLTRGPSDILSSVSIYQRYMMGSATGSRVLRSHIFLLISTSFRVIEYDLTKLVNIPGPVNTDMVKYT